MHLVRMLAAVVTLASLVALPAAAAAWTRTPATTFATLPAGAAHPEGITVDHAGNVYVATFDVAKPAGSPGEIFVYSPSGRLLRRLSVAGSSNLLLDLAFHPTTGALLVIDFGAKQVLTVNPFTGASTSFVTIPGGASAGPNVLTFDAAGNVYISDSFQGVIWRTPPAGVTITAWKADALLTTTGVPPFGANGLAFNGAGNTLFVCNTGNDTVVQIPVLAGGLAGNASVFVNSVNGCDGLIIDEHDNLWLAANQADEIVVVNPAGRVIAKLGDFEGLDPKGAPRGLLFPASLVRSGPFIYVTNLSLDLRLFGLAPPVDAPWAADVRQHTVSKIPAHIPPIPGLR
jgi:sugar lactone lactonase YvrE